jgi:hypothetical protein
MNNNILSKVLMFTAGATIGSVVTWKLLDAKYARRAEKEIEEIRAYYDSKLSKGEDTVPELGDIETVKPTFTEEEKKEYAQIVSNYIGEKGGSKSVEIGTPPYIISPKEFDTLDDYDTESYTYYQDNILTDEVGNVIEDIKNTVGEDFASHFGEYEDDSVFVRNEVLKTDYEILMDYRRYSDVFEPGEDPVDDE